MASSNRHWPSMFKSKPTWHHDITITATASSSSSSSSNSSSRTSPYACDDRSPEPKPRWNPKPEQIRILESIFNSGMVNPPRDEIRKIRAQLQEYGQVGDANVFYWFQNRKSRTKHKLRHLHTKNNPPPPSSTSSSSSDKSSSPPTTTNTNTYFHTHNHTATIPPPPPPPPPHVAAETFIFPLQHHQGITSSPQGLFFSELSNVVQAHHQQPSPPPPHQLMMHNVVGPCTSLLLSEIMMNNNASKKEQQEHASNNNKSLKLMHHTPKLSFCVTPPTTTTATTATVNALLTQVGSGDGSEKITVFINDVAFEVAAGPFNVREAFGEDAVLIHAITGQPLLTNQWGLTLHSLHHGASYYLLLHTLPHAPY
ncbi:WUSCHEL-related homeobox 9-like [Arachis stenosperma]|uniref:WUSCHEL-related homeobox 9-like n=1 Tax=Arachis stenosperma TaxID=217475 RepID=UPI0025AB773E|nr:WUSCHEL-related homeobox 9-like [Arachis stenosperma]